MASSHGRCRWGSAVPYISAPTATPQACCSASGDHVGPRPFRSACRKRVREVLSQFVPRQGRAQFGTKVPAAGAKPQSEKRPRGPLRAWATLVSCGLEYDHETLQTDAPVAPMHTAIHPLQYAGWITPRQPNGPDRRLSSARRGATCVAMHLAWSGRLRAAGV